MEQCGLVVCLEARPETIHSRLEKESRQRGAIVRPMLEAEDPPARIRSLKADRQPGYALSHWTVHTDGHDTGRGSRRGRPRLANPGR